MKRSVLLLTVLLAAITAAPARAFYIVGPTQVPDPNLTQDINYPDSILFNTGVPRGVRLTSPIDGVITSWRTYGAGVYGGATLRLRVLKDEGGGNWRVVRSGPVETPNGQTDGKATERRYAARIPIPAGATIGVEHLRPSGVNLVTLVHDQPAVSPWAVGQYTGAAVADDGVFAPMLTDGQAGSTDPFFPNSAIVEADADHDGFGDETQDRCLGTAGTDAGCPAGAFARPAPPAQGATILGPNLEIDPATAVASNRPTSIVFNDKPAPGVQVQQRFRGVATEWSFYTANVTAGTTAQLRVLRPVGGSAFQAVAQGPVQTLTAGSGPLDLRTFKASVPVMPGDYVGVALGRDSGATLEIVAVKADMSPSTWSWSHFTGTGGNSRFLEQGDEGVPSMQSFNGPVANTFLPITAVVERDADGDLAGDNTQDACLGSAGPAAGCPAPTPTPTATVSPTATPAPIVRLPDRASAVIDAASVRLSADRKQITLKVSCPAQTTTTCGGTVVARTAKKFKAKKGKRRALALGRTKVSVPQGTIKTLTLKVPAATRKALKAVKRVKFKVTLGTSQTVSAST